MMADAVISARIHGLEPTPSILRALRPRPVPPRPVRLTQRVAMKAGRLNYEDGWLAVLERARRAELGAEADGPPRFLVRVDEFPYSSGLDDDRFGLEASRRFHAVMAEEGVPHLMAVVPQWTHAPLDPAASGGRPLDDRDLALLAEMRRDGVTFAQHGTTHRTLDANPRRMAELAGRTQPDVGALLDEGARTLADAGIECRVLVAPFNRFDASQWPALAERFDVITGGPESVSLMGFHGGPLWREGAVYLPCYAPLYESAELVRPAAQAMIERRPGTWIPIVLHTGWETFDDFAALRRLARTVAPYAASWEDLLATVDAARAEEVVDAGDGAGPGGPRP